MSSKEKASGKRKGQKNEEKTVLGIPLADVEDAGRRERILETIPPALRAETTELPDWARALANNTDVLDRFLEERKRRFSFSEQEYNMIQLALAISHQARNCAMISNRKLRASGWDDEKLVEFAMMVATIRRNSVLLSGLGLQ